jgi:type I restriction enzyme S subunit
MGRTALVDKKFPYIILTPQVTYYRVKKGLHNEYLKYYFDSRLFQNLLRNWSGSGSTRAYLGIKAQLKLPIMVPTITEQKAIAATLSCLDDKIELNNRMNQTLEEMAQALFKSWFVDFEPFQDGEFVDSELGMIPKGWSVDTLESIAIIIMGQSPRGSSYNEEKNGEVFYQGRTDFGNRYPKRRLYTTEPKKMAKQKDILMSVRAPVGDINQAYENCCIGRGLCAIRSKNQHDSFLFHLMKSLETRLKVYDNEGTVFGSINKTTLGNIKIIIPPKKVIEEFENIVEKIDTKYLFLSKQIKLLNQLRNTLLPKLMSGEVRVPIPEVK